MLGPLLPAVVVQFLGGGLGNQLFDYAGSRSHADRHGAQLLLDTSLLDASDTPLFVSEFRIRANLRKTLDRTAGLLTRVRRRVFEDVGAMRLHRPRGQYGYFETWGDLPGRCQILGNLISPRFFRENASQIRTDLQLRDCAVTKSRRFQSWAARIQSEVNAIGLHVRRGDLLRPENQWILLPEIHRYTVEAARHVASQVAQPYVFVFTDDPDWCRSELRLGPICFEVVSVAEQSREIALTDFALMQLCRHIVMPNSSFSWWAAYLRPNAGITVLPKVWDPKGVISAEEMTMPGWIRL